MWDITNLILGRNNIGGFVHLIDERDISLSSIFYFLFVMELGFMCMNTNKNLKRAAALIAAAVILTGCASVPSDVKDNKGDTKGVSDSETAELEQIAVSDLEGDVQTALSKEYSQFAFAEGIKVDIPDELQKCTFKQVSGYEENYAGIFSRFFDKAELAGEEISKDTGADGMVSYGFSDELGKKYGCVGNNGFICFAKPSAYDDLFSGGKRVKIYHADRNDDLSDSYQLDGQDVTIGEAVDSAQKWHNENYADLEPDYDISVKTVIVRENDMGVKSFDIMAEKKYKGVALDDLVQKLDDTVSDGQKMKYVTQSIYMQMFKADEIGSMTNGNGLIKPQEEGKLDKIISFSSVMNYLEQSFTDFETKVEISDVNLKYTLTPDYDYKDGQNCYDAGIGFSSHLVWELVIDVKADEMPVGEEYETMGNVQKYIYVDAENGDIDYDFDLFSLIQ